MMPSATRQDRTAAAAVWLAVLAGVGYLAAYYEAFSAMKPFDDEGLLVTTLRRVLSGEVLDTAVPSIYGPFYFFYEAVAHAVLGTAPTTDSVRLVSIFFRVLTAVLCFLVVRRMTRSTALAAVTYAGVFLFLRFTGEEPGHPQEMCIALAVAAVLAVTIRTSISARIAMMACAVAAGTMSKFNFGILMAIALGWVIAIGISPALRRMWLLVVLALPVGLMWPNLGMAWARYFLLLVLCSISGLAITYYKRDLDATLKPRHLLILAGVAAAATALILAITVAQGSSLTHLIDWMVLKPREILGPIWYLAPAISTSRLLIAIAAVGVAAGTRAYVRDARMIAAMKAVFSVALVAMAWVHRPGVVMTFGAPFLWICVIPMPGERVRFERAVLCTLAVLLVLYAYPVAGAQTRFADVLLILAAAVNLGDVPWWKGKRTAAFAAAAAALLFVGAMAWRAHDLYESFEPLNLPGAYRLRLKPERVAAIRQIVSRARSSCSVLVTIPGMPSFNLWSGIRPFEGLRVGKTYEILRSGTWATGEEDGAQARAVAQLGELPRACIVYNREIINFWTHGIDLSGRPIIRAMQEYRPVFSGAQITLLKNPADQDDLRR